MLRRPNPQCRELTDGRTDADESSRFINADGGMHDRRWLANTTAVMFESVKVGSRYTSSNTNDRRADRDQWFSLCAEASKRTCRCRCRCCAGADGDQSNSVLHRGPGPRMHAPRSVAAATTTGDLPGLGPPVLGRSRLSRSVGSRGPSCVCRRVRCSVTDAGSRPDRTGQACPDQSGPAQAGPSMPGPARAGPPRSQDRRSAASR